MRIFRFGILLLAAALIGCDDAGVPKTPSELEPLTEEQKAAIARQDADVADEESRAPDFLPKKAAGKKKGG